MQVICEATQNSSVAVQVGAFECLVRIMSLYYDKMAFYMEQALFGVRVYSPVIGRFRHLIFSSSRLWG
jgi:importin subunit beta-1